MGRSFLATAPWLVTVACSSRSPGASALAADGAVRPALDAAATEAGQVREEDGATSGESGFIDGAALDGALVFDLGGDFSFARNPNGVWRYGYTVGAAGGPFVLDSFASDAGGDPIAFWHPSDPAADGGVYYPYVAENAGTASASEEDSWALQPREVAVEGSNSGQYGEIAFVAPVAGTYQIRAHFEGVHFRLSTTDVHVIAGDASLFASSISGYGGDPAFHAIEGVNPTADYDDTVRLAANEVLTFAIGYGANMTNYNDTTGLTVHIVLTGN